MTQKHIKFKTTKTVVRLPSSHDTAIPSPKRPIDNTVDLPADAKRLKLVAKSEDRLTAADADHDNIEGAAKLTTIQNSNFSLINQEPNKSYDYDPSDVADKCVYVGFSKLEHDNLLKLTYKTFLNPITPNSQRNGILYLFTRDGDPQYVKIGMTFDRLANPKARFKSRCKFEPRFHLVMEQIPFAARVEFMIHRELEALGLRRIEPVCKYGHPVTTQENIADDKEAKYCAGGHQEWFEMDIDGYAGAKGIMERWVEFMRIAQPYGTDGVLKKELKEKIMSFQWWQFPLTVNVLWAMWTEIHNPVALSTKLVNRQISWYQAIRKKQHQFEHNKRKRGEVDFNSNKNAVFQLADYKKMTGEADCIREWFSDIPGENVCLGCSNLAHGDEFCAWQMHVEYNPTNPHRMIL